MFNDIIKTKNTKLYHSNQTCILCDKELYVLSQKEIHKDEPYICYDCERKKHV